MSKKVKFTSLQKLKFILTYRKKKSSLAQFCRKYQVEATGMKRWRIKCDAQGLLGLEEYIRFYPKERMQKNLGGKTPLEYKEDWFQSNIDNSIVY